MTVGVEHPERLLEQLLAGLVALEDDNAQRRPWRLTRHMPRQLQPGAERRSSRDDGFRLREEPGARRAVFCRLEHVVPWAIQGAALGAPARSSGEAATRSTAAPTAGGARGRPLVLVRHRGEHRIPDGFCSVDHLRAWAKAGGRWR